MLESKQVFLLEEVLLIIWMKQHLEILFSLKGMEIKPEQILRGVTPPLIQRFLQTEQLLSIQFYIIIKILQNTLISLGCIPNPPGQ